MKLFNKTLIAAAVTAVSANAIAATVITPTSADISQELAMYADSVGLQGSAAIAIAPTTNDYNSADKLVFTLSGAEVAFATRAALTLSGASADAACDDGVSAALENVTWSVSGGEIKLASNTTLEVNLASTNGALLKACLETADNTNTDVILTLDGEGADNFIVTLDSTDVNSEVKVSYAALSTTGLTGTVDSAKAVAISNIVDEFDLNIAVADRFGKKIDVAEDRMLFDDTASNTDSITISTDVVASPDLTFSNVEYVIDADLSFLDADADGNIDTNNSITVSSGFTVNTDDLTAIKVIETTPAGNAPTVTITVDGAREVPVTTFTVNSEVIYTNATTSVNWPASLSKATETDTASGGSWALNGSTGAISYMPYGEGITQIIYVTNTSAVEGGVSYTARDEAGTEYSGTLATTVAAKGVTAIAGDLKTSLEAQGFTKGKLALSINVEAPSTSIYASYNVGGADRGFVSNK